MQFLDWKIINIKKKNKTNLKTGVGSCNAQPLPSTNEVFYCTGSFSSETMSNCNKLAGKKCWNPVDGAATTATCGNNDFQCKVNIYFETDSYKFVILCNS